MKWGNVVLAATTRSAGGGDETASTNNDEMTRQRHMLFKLWLGSHIRVFGYSN